MEPALATSVTWARIPGNTQRLEPTVWKFDEVLLKRIDAKRIGNRILLKRPVLAFGPYKVFTVAL